MPHDASCPRFAHPWRLILWVVKDGAGQAWRGSRKRDWIRLEVADMAIGKPVRSASSDDNLISQKGVAVGQVEYGLVGKLFRMVSARASLKNDPVFRVDDV